MNDLLISVTGAEGSGKSAVLRILLEALADHGLLSVADTKAITLNPNAFFGHARITNGNKLEEIDIEICPEALVEYHLKRPE